MSSLSKSIPYPKEEMLDNRDKFPEDETSMILTNVLGLKYDGKSQVGVTSTTMTSSIASILDDSTPSDSGVQLLDSVSSDMNESFMSNCGLDYDSSNNAAVIECVSNSVNLVRQPQCYVDEIHGSVNTLLPDVVMATANDTIPSNQTLHIDEVAMTKSDIDNSNVDTDFLLNDSNGTDIPNEMTTSTCSTFDTDVIVFRRKVKKTRTDSTGSTGSSVKKRVSFHEDILKNTRTDNIHIEHGFITYKGYSKKTPHKFLRNSWCSQGHCDDYEDESGNTCYRNACSDVLDYGKTDLYEHGNSEVIQYDNSGVFEYTPQEMPTKKQPHGPSIERAASNDERQFYNCKCSSSNSSLESSDSSNGNNNQNKRTDYSRAKSSSCDCIGLAAANKLNNNHPQITDNCYFSEPCIETMDESFKTLSPKSVWRKEMKPKGSCLKKNRRETDVILEYDLTSKVKSFNVHQLSDMNNLFGSLKNIFSMPLPERGVPEGCEDLQTVYECVPEGDGYSPIKKPQIQCNVESPMTASTSSIPGSAEKKRRAELSLFPIPAEDEMVHVAIADDSNFISEARDSKANMFRNKFIINCESTVFEHTGVFCENRDDNNIPDIPSSNSVCITPQKPSKSILSFSTTPLKQKLSNIFYSFRDNGSSVQQKATSEAALMEQNQRHQQAELQIKLKKLQEEQKFKPWDSPVESSTGTAGRFPSDVDSLGTASMTSSMISYSSDKNSIVSSSTVASSTNTMSGQDKIDGRNNLNPPKVIKTVDSNSNSPNKKSRHLSSPLHRKSTTSKFDRSRLSPDLFCGQKAQPNPMVLLSEEFDDLLTVTTTTSDTEINDSEIEVIDYATMNEIPQVAPVNDTPNQFLRPPSTKSSLINRFLRNVTQKKINDATIKKNNILSAKYRDPPKLFSNLYVKPRKPIDFDLAADLNAEIALEIEVNAGNRKESVSQSLADVLRAKEEYGVGVGEVCVDIFDKRNLHILRDDRETLIKVSNKFVFVNESCSIVLIFLV